ncbi:hypothetical protein DIPPA_07029 [Diplonema papillatum]|nr:hypothetical protein DIPPA_07029 [Diplonema papillatum]|eukprot:gene3793-5916_t
MVETFEVSSKHLPRAQPCTVLWNATVAEKAKNEDEAELPCFEISVAGKTQYTVAWSHIACANVKLNLHGVSDVVLDCVPEGSAKPMLIKLRVPSLTHVDELVKLLREHNVPFGANRLWPLLSTKTAMPFYHRLFNRAWLAASFLLEFMLISVTIFLLLDFLGMHEPGVSDDDFTEKVSEILHNETDFAVAQAQLQEAAHGLSSADQATLAKRWKRLGWGYTLLNDTVLQHPRRAIRALRDRDYLAYPTRHIWRQTRRFAEAAYHFDYLDHLKQHPYSILAVPMALAPVFFLSAFLVWVFLFGIVIYMLQHATLLVLSIEAVVALKHFVLNAKSIYSSVRALVRIVTDGLSITKKAVSRVKRKQGKDKPREDVAKAD